MVDSKPPDKEVDASALIEEISKLQPDALGEGAATCQSCGEEIGEGEDLTAYFFRPPLNHTYKLGMVCCADDGPCPDTEFTLGVKELVVKGRVGWTTDHRTQSSWPVLLAPHLFFVSPPGTDEAVDVRERAIKMTVPVTEEPDVWTPFLPDGEIERITDPEVLEEELPEDADIEEYLAD